MSNKIGKYWTFDSRTEDNKTYFRHGAFGLSPNVLLRNYCRPIAVSSRQLMLVTQRSGKLDDP